MDVRKRDDRGQAILAAAIVVSMCLLVPVAYAVVSTSNRDVNARANHIQAAKQAAQAGLATFEKYVNGDQKYPTQHCSHGNFTCTENGTTITLAPSANPALVNILTTACTTSTWTHHFSNAATTTTPATNRVTSLSKTMTHWVRASGTTTGFNTEYQYVVHPTVTLGIGYLYVTGRAGKSGHYVCSSLRASFGVKTVSQACGTCGLCPPIAIPTTVNFADLYIHGGNGKGATGSTGGNGASMKVAVPVPKTIYLGSDVGCTGTTGGTGTPAPGGTGFANGGESGDHSGSGGGATGTCLMYADTIADEKLCDAATKGTTSPSPTSSNLQPCSSPSSLAGWEAGSVTWTPVTAAKPVCVLAVAGGGGGGANGFDTTVTGSGGAAVCKTTRVTITVNGQKESFYPGNQGGNGKAGGVSVFGIDILKGTLHGGSGGGLKDTKCSATGLGNAGTAAATNCNTKTYKWPSAAPNGCGNGTNDSGTVGGLGFGDQLSSGGGGGGYAPDIKTGTVAFKLQGGGGNGQKPGPCVFGLLFYIGTCTTSGGAGGGGGGTSFIPNLALGYTGLKTATGTVTSSTAVPGLSVAWLTIGPKTGPYTKTATVKCTAVTAGMVHAVSTTVSVTTIKNVISLAFKMTGGSGGGGLGTSSGAGGESSGNSATAVTMTAIEWPALEKVRNITYDIGCQGLHGSSSAKATGGKGFSTGGTGFKGKTATTGGGSGGGSTAICVRTSKATTTKCGTTTPTCVASPTTGCVIAVAGGGGGGASVGHTHTSGGAGVSAGGAGGVGGDKTNKTTTTNVLFGGSGAAGGTPQAAVGGKGKTNKLCWTKTLDPATATAGKRNSKPANTPAGCIGGGNAETPSGTPTLTPPISPAAWGVGGGGGAGWGGSTTTGGGAGGSNYNKGGGGGGAGGASYISKSLASTATALTRFLVTTGKTGGAVGVNGANGSLSITYYKQRITTSGVPITDSTSSTCGKAVSFTMPATTSNLQFSLRGGQGAVGGETSIGTGYGPAGNGQTITGKFKAGTATDEIPAFTKMWVVYGCPGATEGTTAAAKGFTKGGNPSGGKGGGGGGSTGLCVSATGCNATMPPCLEWGPYLTAEDKAGAPGCVLAVAGGGGGGGDFDWVAGLFGVYAGAGGGGGSGAKSTLPKPPESPGSTNGGNARAGGTGGTGTTGVKACGGGQAGCQPNTYKNSTVVATKLKVCPTGGGTGNASNSGNGCLAANVGLAGGAGGGGYRPTTTTATSYATCTEKAHDTLTVTGNNYSTNYFCITGGGAPGSDQGGVFGTYGGGGGGGGGAGYIVPWVTVTPSTPATVNGLIVVLPAPVDSTTW